MKRDIMPVVGRALTLAVATLGVAGTADAHNSLHLSGFGTVGYAVLDETDLSYGDAYTPDPTDDSGSFELDSRLGVQLDAEASDRISGTLQILSRQQWDDTWTPEIEWAFVRARLNDALSVRVGRIVVPVFLYSDYRNVGYALTPVRPAMEVYGEVPTRHLDGADLTGQFETGDVWWTAQVYGGESELEAPDGSVVTLNDMLGFNLTAEYGIAKVRAGFVDSDASIDSSGFTSAVTALESSLPLLQLALEPESFAAIRDVAGQLGQRSVQGRFTSLGLELDLDPWFVQGEYTYRDLGGLYGDNFAWSALLGHRLDAFTPYGFVSDLRSEKQSIAIDLPDVPALAPISQLFESLDQTAHQRTVGIGLRWDFAPNVAVKAQYEHVQSDTLVANLRATDGRVNVEDSVGLYSFVFDFVF